jgi:predicted nuclease with TOPRIM domain
MQRSVQSLHACAARSQYAHSTLDRTGRLWIQQYRQLLARHTGHIRKRSKVAVGHGRCGLDPRLYQLTHALHDRNG